MKYQSALQTRIQTSLSNRNSLDLTIQINEKLFLNGRELV